MLLVPQETPLNMLFAIPPGLGVACSRQEAPFHASATVRPVAVVVELPTAVQEFAEVHHTPLSELPREAVGLGVG
jgi:hypothetical protein